MCPAGIDSWINLSRVDPDAEVQGEVRLAVQVQEDVRGRRLRCHVLQARYAYQGGQGARGSQVPLGSTCSLGFGPFSLWLMGLQISIPQGTSQLLLEFQGAGQQTLGHSGRPSK